jgi:hypothetical protein
MGAVLGMLEDGNLMARQKERYYAFLLPKSAVTIPEVSRHDYGSGH